MWRGVTFLWTLKPLFKWDCGIKKTHRTNQKFKSVGFDWRFVFSTSLCNNYCNKLNSDIKLVMTYCFLEESLFICKFNDDHILVENLPWFLKNEQYIDRTVTWVMHGRDACFVFFCVFLQRFSQRSIFQDKKARSHYAIRSRTTLFGVTIQ